MPDRWSLVDFRVSPTEDASGHRDLDSLILENLTGAHPAAVPAALLDQFGVEASLLTCPIYFNAFLARLRPVDLDPHGVGTNGRHILHRVASHRIALHHLLDRPTRCCCSNNRLRLASISARPTKEAGILLSAERNWLGTFEGGGGLGVRA